MDFINIVKNNLSFKKLSASIFLFLSKNIKSLNLQFSPLRLKPITYIGLTQSDAVQGASEACDQAVLLYRAEANERSNEEMRRLRKSYYNLKTGKGFTLLESLVAISILMIAAASSLTIVQKGLSSAFHAKDQIIASYLAQDAIEYIINWSDQNVVNGAAGGWLDVIKTECSTLSPCGVDTSENYSSSLGIQKCSVRNCTLNYDSLSNSYNYKVGGVASPFTRSVKVDENVTGVEALITVTVFWSDKGLPTSLEFNTRIFNWK